MSEEKQTEPFNWKNRLDALDGLPEEPAADKNAAWEKLHHRLQEKPRHNKAIWYWMAAACLLFVMILSWMITNKKRKYPGEVRSRSTFSGKENAADKRYRNTG